MKKLNITAQNELAIALLIFLFSTVGTIWVLLEIWAYSEIMFLFMSLPWVAGVIYGMLFIYVISRIQKYKQERKNEKENT